MASIKELDSKIANLQIQANGIQQEISALKAERTAAIAAERATAIPNLIALITTLGLNATDLGLAKQPKTKNIGSTPKKFRDPVSGEEWSGRGAQPRWIQGKDKNMFLITAPDLKTDISPPVAPAKSLVKEPD